jgi:single-strand DNA-binding protein
MNVNKAIVVGRITNDLELKSTNTGREVLSFGIATNQNWTDQSGQKQEKTDFHNIVFWGKQAATLAQYAVKGQELYVEGRLETSTWDDADVKKNYKTEIVGNNFQFGQKPSGAGGGGAQAASAGSAATGAAAAQPSKDVAYPDEEIDPEDIPF